jgi:hypothetical protein
MGVRVVPAFDFADTAPIDGSGIPVLLVAGDNTTLATDALGGIEVKAILFTRLWGAQRDAVRRIAGCPLPGRIRRPG